VDEIKPANFRSLSSKFSRFTVLLFLWMVALIVLWDVRSHTFDAPKAILMCVIVVLLGGLLSRFTMRALGRPLALLQQGITSVREGKFEPIQISSTHDEIQYLGESFNQMIAEINTSQAEIRQHRDLLEERIRQRTEDLEKAMRTALAASQAKSEFLANMSHELRTPMNGLLGMLEVVLDSSLSAEQREELAIAQRSAYALLALLNDILDLSKIEAGKMMIESIPYNVRTVLDDCVKSFQARATQKKIELRLEIDSAAPSEVIGDPLRVRQIAANLLSNALKFTELGWVSLRLSTAASADGPAQMKIAVSDTGAGIDAAKLTAIFEKFTQADGSITRKYGGTGLGLAITKRLVEMQNGNVDVESQLGKGSTFTVTLPWTPVAEPAASSLAPEAGVALKKITPSEVRVLLVEDNLVNQKVVLAILRKKGYHIDVASDGREALSKLDATLGAPSQAYNVVLMDVQMPVLDGLETTRIMRLNSRWDRLPIIAMTAHAMNGDRERCLQAGMNSYVSKPIQPALLLSIIEKQLQEQTIETPQSSHGNAPDNRVPTRLLHEDAEMANDLLEVFLQLAPERLERLEAAAAEADGTTLGSESRKISEAAEQLASRALKECAQRIELAARSRDFSAALQELQTLRREIAELQALTA
jgi:signal transduction histidine kinase/CheY-like chemotaxis protein/HPt (histidine-containing phosphotransfer) domain-containing protein